MAAIVFFGPDLTLNLLNLHKSDRGRPGERLIWTGELGWTDLPS
jgi:hypothetical protein